MSHYSGIGQSWKTKSEVAKAFVQERRTEKVLARPSYKDLAGAWGEA